MRSSRARGARLFGVLALVSLVIPASAAAVESSQISTPAGTTYLFDESGSKLSVAGTAVGMAEVSIRCYAGPESSEYSTVAEKVTVTAGAFSAEVSTRPLFTMPCQLRAVPVGSAKSLLGPGSKTEFEGPLLVASEFLPEAINYLATSSTLAGAFYFESAGHFALESSLYSTAGHSDPSFFFGEADLTAKPPIGSRSTIRVDGANGYVPFAAKEIESKLEVEAKAPVKLSGKPSVTVAKEFNEVTRQITIREEDPVVKCSPGNEYPPLFKEGACTSFVSTGVTLVRSWQTSNEDHVAWLTDRWLSTDGAAHTVNARYYTELTGSAEGDVLRFPGEAAFAATNKGESKTLPAGPGTILIKSAPGLPEGGNGENPQGAIGYDAAPSEPVAVTKGSSKAEVKPEVNVFEMPYQRTVPAGGSSSTLRMVFTQAFALTEAQALSEAAIASYYPAVSITSPANGSSITSSTPAVTVTGTASDGVAVSSLTVNGKAVAVGSGGVWSTSVSLTPGTNTLTATATNQSGLSRSASVTVHYIPAIPQATASQVGRTSGANGQVTFRIACHGVAGTRCRIHATLTTVEKLRHGRVIGLAAAKIRSKTITVASLTLLIPAGQTVKVSLKPNSTGRKLLARFHRLPVHLTATLEGAAGRTTIIAQNLTIKPRPKPHHKHKH